MPIIHVHTRPHALPHEGTLTYEAVTLDCALGKNGVIDANAKREGDHKTPLGTWPIRRVFYRADKVTLPEGLSFAPIAITPAMGWCDAPDHPLYNQLVELPFSASYERMWREDDCYDVVIELGYNDNPAVAGHGSAIFFHCTRPSGDDAHPLHHTEGCVAIPKAVMLELLPMLTPNSIVNIA